MYKIIANGIEFVFHDIHGETLNMNILDTFNIPYKFEKIDDI